MLEFKESISPGDIVARQVHDSFYGTNMLELCIAGTTDKVSISGFFVSDSVTNPYNPVQQVKFADGTVWDATAILDKLHAGTGGSNPLRGTDGTDANDANDALSAGARSDMLSTGAGEHRLKDAAVSMPAFGSLNDETIVIRTAFARDSATSPSDPLENVRFENVRFVDDADIEMDALIARLKDAKGQDAPASTGSPGSLSGDAGSGETEPGSGQHEPFTFDISWSNVDTAPASEVDTMSDALATYAPALPYQSSLLDDMARSAAFTSAWHA